MTPAITFFGPERSISTISFQHVLDDLFEPNHDKCDISYSFFFYIYIQAYTTTSTIFPVIKFKTITI